MSMHSLRTPDPVTRARRTPARGGTLMISVACLAALAAGACRTPRRSLRVAGEAATLKVTMAGLAETDLKRGEWVYELSICVPTINGTLDTDGTAVFKAVGLKKGLTSCQLKVRSLQPMSGVTFATDSEPGVLYWAREFQLSQNSTGELIAVAPMQKLYTIVAVGDSVFTLKVPVTFPAAETGTVISGALLCEPDLVNIGRLDRTTAEAGTMTFRTEVKSETAFACTELQVGVDGVARKYKGTFDGDSGKFTAAPGGEKQLAELKLVLQQIDPVTGDTIDVSTVGKECTGDKVFDVSKKQCVDRPAGP